MRESLKTISEVIGDVVLWKHSSAAESKYRKTEIYLSLVVGADLLTCRAV